MTRCRHVVDSTYRRDVQQSGWTGEAKKRAASLRRSACRCGSEDQNRTVTPPTTRFRRSDDEQLVVDRAVDRDFAEEIPDADERFPLRVREVQERQRLRDLHVESGGEPGLGRGASCRRTRC